MREEHFVVPADFPTRESFQQRLDEIIRSDRYLGNLGSTGRKQLFDRAYLDWEGVPAEAKLEPLMLMRERGLLSREEYFMLAHETGYSDAEAESMYRKWSGTEQAIWAMKWRGFLRRGEYTQLYRMKGLTRGQAWYRYRKYLDVNKIRPFVRVRGKPRERRKLAMG